MSFGLSRTPAILAGVLLFIDGRTIRTWHGEPDWDADPELAAARLVIAPRSSPLAALLRHPWHIVYQDEQSIVFRR